MIILDENISNSLSKLLAEKRYELYPIRLFHKGLNDEDITKIVIKKNGVLITEDSDFGKLVFANNIKDLSVIFLKFERLDRNLVYSALLKVLEVYYPFKEHTFVTITANKTRIRLL